MHFSSLRRLYCFVPVTDDEFVNRALRSKVWAWMKLTPGRGQAQQLVQWCRTGRLDLIQVIEDVARDRFPQLLRIMPAWAESVSSPEELLVKLLSSPGNKGYTPVIAAARAGHSDILEILLRAGASRFNADKRGMTALCHAASKGHHNCVATLMGPSTQGELVANLVDVAASAGITPLHFAVARGHDKVVAELLSYNPEINVRVTNYCYIDGISFLPMSTPLHIAARLGHGECIQAILHFYVCHRDSDSISDPRLARVHRILPYEMAQPGLSKDIIDMLHPQSDLEAFFPNMVEEQVGVPRLSLLCAPVVRSSLIESLDRASILSSRFCKTSNLSDLTHTSAPHSKAGTKACSSMLVDSVMAETRWRDDSSTHSNSNVPLPLVEEELEVDHELGVSVPRANHMLPSFLQRLKRDTSTHDSASTSEGCSGRIPSRLRPMGKHSTTEIHRVATLSGDTFAASSLRNVPSGGSPVSKVANGLFTHSLLNSPQLASPRAETFLSAPTFRSAFDEVDMKTSSSKEEAAHPPPAAELVQCDSLKSSSSYGQECGICFNDKANRVILPCHHKLCEDCATVMCQRLESAPVNCPFCRGVIRGFDADVIQMESCVAGPSGVAADD